MAQIGRITTDAVLVPRAVLDTIAEALASIVQVSGEGFGLLIERLDQHDGDPDAETGNDVEDDFMLSPDALHRTKTDPTSDPFDCEAGAYVEWHTKPANLRRHGQAEIVGDHEDDEDSDPAEEDDDPGQCSEDEISTSMSAAFGYGPGCPISDPGY